MVIVGVWFIRGNGAGGRVDGILPLDLITRDARKYSGVQVATGEKKFLGQTLSC